MDNCYAIKEFLPEQERGFHGVVRECKSEYYTNVVRFKDIQRMHKQQKKQCFLSRLMGR